MDGPVILEELFPCVVAGVDAVDDRVDDVQRGWKRSSTFVRAASSTGPSFTPAGVDTVPFKLP